MMNKLSPILCAVALAASFGAAAQDRSARAVYEAERQACMEGRTTHDDRANCLREAAAAYAEAKRGRLGNNVSEAQRRENALLRCREQPAAERLNCERMARGEGKVSGSVAEGAIVKELVTRSVEPVPAAPR
jgi:hypothetical protein